MFFKRSTFEYVVVGLGNPGRQYEATRHNVGFVALDRLASRFGARIERSRFDALVTDVKIGGRRVLLMKPQTYMNLSGRSVAAAARFYKLPPERVVVVCDDVSLAVGALRIRADGSAGGHNGLKSIIAELGSDGFARVKIGVSNDSRYDLADWVLSKLSPNEAAAVSAVAERAAEAAAAVVELGIQAAQSRYNRTADA